MCPTHVHDGIRSRDSRVPGLNRLCPLSREQVCTSENATIAAWCAPGAPQPSAASEDPSSVSCIGTSMMQDVGFVWGVLFAGICRSQTCLRMAVLACPAELFQMLCFEHTSCQCLVDLHFPNARELRGTHMCFLEKHIQQLRPVCRWDRPAAILVERLASKIL